MVLKRPIVNDKLTESLLERYNPFGFTTAEGLSMQFVQPIDAYSYVLNTVYTNFVNGFIEMPVLLMTFYKTLDFREALALAKKLEVSNFLERYIVLPSSWNTPDVKEFFDKLCSALCGIAGTSYNSSYLNTVWNLFQYRIQLQNSNNEKQENNEREKEKTDENGNGKEEFSQLVEGTLLGGKEGQEIRG